MPQARHKAGLVLVTVLRNWMPRMILWRLKMDQQRQLEQRQLDATKLVRVIQLQAAFRGFIVRQIYGTYRCVIDCRDCDFDRGSLNSLDGAGSRWLPRQPSQVAAHIAPQYSVVPAEVLIKPLRPALDVKLPAPPQASASRAPERRWVHSQQNAPVMPDTVPAAAVRRL